MNTTDELYNEIKDMPIQADILFSYILDQSVLHCVKYKTESNRFIIYVGIKKTNNIVRKLKDNLYNKKLPIIIIKEDEPTFSYRIVDVYNDIKISNEIIVCYL